jgi:hypothetical protein
MNITLTELAGEPRPPFGLPEVLVAIHTSRQPCRKAGKAPIFTPIRESSGESRYRTIGATGPFEHTLGTIVEET